MPLAESDIVVLPDLSAYCNLNFSCVNGQARLCVPFPGGAEICAVFPVAKVPDPSEMVAALLQSVNAALAPLGMIFTIIEVAIAVVDCIKAIQKAICNFPPDPFKISECIPGLEQAIAKLLKLIPYLVIPALVGALLDAIICFLTGIRNQILSIIQKLTKILAAQTRASKLPSLALASIADCASQNVDLALQNMAAGAAPIGRIIGIINALLQLAGAQPNADGTGPIPDISTAFGTEAAAMIQPLDDAITVLQTIRNFFP